MEILARKVILVFSLSALMLGCDPMGFLDSMGDVPPFASLEEANTWINATIAYEKDSDFDFGPHEDWKLPNRTLADGAGDCEDMAALLVYIAEDQFGLPGYLVALKNTKTGTGHMIALVDGVYYDPNRHFFTKDWAKGYPGFAFMQDWSFEEYCRIAATSPYRSIQ